MFQELKNEKIAQELGITPDDLCKWDAESKTLLGSQKAKARAFNRLKLVQYNGNGEFIVKPIKGYNSTTYVLKKVQEQWRCSCQWSSRRGLVCSHLQALFLFLRIKGDK